MKTSFLQTLRLPAGLAFLACAALAGCGGGSGGAPAAAPPVAVTPVPTPAPTPSQQAQVTVIAGTKHDDGVPVAFKDGKGTMASFNRPEHFVLDKNGVIYATDACGIRKIATDGTVSTLAGAGAECDTSVDGTGAEARFTTLTGMTADAAGNLYVAEYGAIRRVTPEGVVTTLAGGVRSRDQQDGIGAGATFYTILALDIGPDGNLLVSDGEYVGRDRESPKCGPGANRLRQVTLQGVVTTLPESVLGCVAGAEEAPLALAVGLRFDSIGNLYLFHGHHLVKRDVDGSARYLNNEKGERIYAGGMPGVEALKLAPDDAGSLFYLDSYSLYKLAPDGSHTIPLDIDTVGARRVRGLTYIGNHQFLTAFDNQIVKVTLK
ncbi:hypothetical protein HH212_21375 [Massilia forsythiae]|uniref:Uncharacterized protein n=1 Tax=Massilia forsythiae TaxID=2728020 RepID=A0A7Z2W0N0_9BURK|nr:hypothetical protein [Massilia forsythiae]QJE02255.1 hypothetical protein HH212_21375 [Massilia forsythiae]